MRRRLSALDHCLVCGEGIEISNNLEREPDYKVLRSGIVVGHHKSSGSNIYNRSDIS